MTKSIQELAQEIAILKTRIQNRDECLKQFEQISNIVSKIQIDSRSKFTGQKTIEIIDILIDGSDIEKINEIRKQWKELR